ncbi:hypothetical protein ACWEV3_01145 [Saccharopolyspora sp. NPDC003752]
MLLTAVPDGVDAAAAATIARKDLVALGMLRTARLAPDEIVRHPSGPNGRQTAPPTPGHCCPGSAR